VAVGERLVLKKKHHSYAERKHRIAETPTIPFESQLPHCHFPVNSVWRELRSTLEKKREEAHQEFADKDKAHLFFPKYQPASIVLFSCRRIFNIDWYEVRLHIGV